MDNKNRYLLAVAALITLLLSIFFVAREKGIESADSLAMALGRNVVVASWQAPHGITEAIDKIDFEDEISFASNASNLDDLDVLLIFADGWPDTVNFPYAASLSIQPKYFEHLAITNSDFDDEILVVFENKNLTTDQILYSLVVNLQKLDKISPNCIPSFIYDGIMSIPSAKKIPMLVDSYQACEN